MKINEIMNKKIYKSQYAQDAKAVAVNKAGKAGTAPKTDTISISSAGARSAQMTKAVQEITRSVAKDATPERIEALKKAIQRGEYGISSQDVADAILGRAKGE